MTHATCTSEGCTNPRAEGRRHCAQCRYKLVRERTQKNCDTCGAPISARAARCRNCYEGRGPAEFLNCTVPWCSNPSRNRRTPGLCNGCYTWKRLNGGADPSYRQAVHLGSVDDAVRRALHIASDANGCRDSRNVFSLTHQGYPTVQIRGERYLVTRLVLESALGRPIRPGMFACHRCDTPPCVSPEHLFEDTAAGNAADMVAKGRQTWGERNPNSTVTENDVREIRRRHVPGRNGNTRDLAEEFGIHPNTVRAIMRGEIWARVRD